MSERKPYRLEVGVHGRREGGEHKVYRAGETILLTEAETLKSLAGRVTPLFDSGAPKAEAKPAPKKKRGRPKRAG